MKTETAEPIKRLEVIDSRKNMWIGEKETNEVMKRKTEKQDDEIRAVRRYRIDGLTASV